MRRRERVALDRAHAEPGALVEAQVADVGRGGGDDEHRAALRPRELDGGGDQARGRSPRPRCDGSTAMFLISLRCASLRLDELQVPDDPSPDHGDEHLPRVEVGVELRGGILGHREQRPQLAARARVALDATAAGIDGRPLRLAHCDQGTIPASGRGGSSSIARYSSRCPSGRGSTRPRPASSR